MITLLNATRVINASPEPRQILSDVSISFPAKKRIGILASAGTGKSTLARLLCGIERPNSGHVFHDGRVSWPMGFAGGFHPELTVAENIALLGKIICEDAYELIAFCSKFGELDHRLNHPAKNMSPTERLACAFSLSLAVQCDVYIADDTIGFGDGVVRRKTEAMLEVRLQNAGLIFLSRNHAQLEKFCDHFFVLVDGKLLPCKSAKIGQKALDLFAKRHPVTPQDEGLSTIPTDFSPKFEINA